MNEYKYPTSFSLREKSQLPDVNFSVIKVGLRKDCDPKCYYDIEIEGETSEVRVFAIRDAGPLFFVSYSRRDSSDPSKNIYFSLSQTEDQLESWLNSIEGPVNTSL